MILHPAAHSFCLLMRINLSGVLLGILFIPKHLKLFACGKPSRNSSNKSCEGYRTQGTPKITQSTKGG
jgi:hypothetical protein